MKKSISFNPDMLLRLVMGIDVSFNYRLHFRNKKHKDKVEKQQDEGLAKKLKPDKTKIKQDKKDIVIIIDESDKHKDELDEQVEAVTINMDGFERIHLEQYEKQLEQYKRFLAEYLRESNNVLKPGYDQYKSDDDGKRKFQWGQEVVTYIEVKDIARRAQMNSLMSGMTGEALGGHNDISWQEVQDYKFWKLCSKFNEQMSFLLYEKIGE
ncbi:MAG: hypothetical protein ABIG89_03495 [Candidatus Woesearchaeota archaeon]